MPLTAAPIVLDAAEEVELRRRAAASTAQRDAKRAEIIVLAAQGWSSAGLGRRRR